MRLVLLFEQQKSHKRLLPLSALRTIIQSGEDFVQQKISSPVGQFRDEVKRKADSIETGSQKAVREFVDSTQRSLDEMQRRIDERPATGPTGDGGSVRMPVWIDPVHGFSTPMCGAIEAIACVLAYPRGLEAIAAGVAAASVLHAALGAAVDAVSSDPSAIDSDVQTVMPGTAPDGARMSGMHEPFCLWHPPVGRTRNPFSGTSPRDSCRNRSRSIPVKASPAWQRGSHCSDDPAANG